MDDRQWTAEIVATGDEIRTGALVDTNSAYIAESLVHLGVEVRRHHAVGDDVPLLAGLLAEVAGRAPICIVTGGLGPTQDDVSAQAAAQAAGLPLVEDPQALEVVRRFFHRRRRPMSPTNRKQALIPQGAAVLDNPVGTAPGFALTIGRCRFFFLPGVPQEMRTMMQQAVMPAVARMVGASRLDLSPRTITTFGLPESVVGEQVAAACGRLNGVRVGLRAHFPQIQVKLYPDPAAPDPQMLDQAVDAVCRQLGDHVVSRNGAGLAQAVVETLLEQGRSLALAESCTGGLIGHLVTAVAGASGCLLGGVVAYDNEVKVKLLGVEPRVLADCGAVSRQVAGRMAAGVRRLLGADFGLATSGIAGPTGGSAEKPVGTVCIGLATADRTVAWRWVLDFGDRKARKRIFAAAALNVLRLAAAGRPLPQGGLVLGR